MHDLIIIDQVILIASECQGLTVSWGCAGESSAILASSGETALRRALMRQASWATPTTSLESCTSSHICDLHVPSIPEGLHEPAGMPASLPGYGDIRKYSYDLPGGLQRASGTGTPLMPVMGTPGNAAVRDTGCFQRASSLGEGYHREPNVGLNLRDRLGPTASLPVARSSGALGPPAGTVGMGAPSQMHAGANGMHRVQVPMQYPGELGLSDLPEVPPFPALDRVGKSMPTQVHMHGAECRVQC